MTDTNTTITEAEAVAALTKAAARPEVMDFDAVDHVPVYVPDGGKVEWHDGRRNAATPPRKQGAAHLHDAASFGTYVNAHTVDGTVIYGNAPDGRIVAVVNDHIPYQDTAGWGDHTATWKLRHSPAWTAWTRHAGQWLNQRQFAEHLEDNAADVIEPSAAEMLEVAQTLQANKSVAFRTHTRLRDGQTQLQYEETVESRAGERGQLEVPTMFTIGVPVYDGLDAYKLTARFRFRVNDGNLSVMYRLDRTADVLSAAFDQAWAAALAEVPDSIVRLLGTPPDKRL